MPQLELSDESTPDRDMPCRGYSPTWLQRLGERQLKTGLAGFDWTVVDLRPGEFYCVAGRPCTGKTQLLLDLALRVHRRYETNVVFATAQEFPEQIIARAPKSARACLVELPALGVLWPDGLERLDRLRAA